MRGLFYLYIYIKKTLKIFLLETTERFQYNLVEMFPCWPSTKIIQAVMIRQKIWPLVGRADFSYIPIQKNLKIFLPETTGPISI